ncbi:hypothetical protein TL16_g06675 [Triparma laevis f. inornata]|uniref:FAD-binding FR-type domain-containing protein n=2 Tax=Triparma laevis TaxID=1534972 RepID=A0A9W7FD04_9STRA|nr:hypothetical protein TL16_g06675 [Triparma laevis f. inornata]GMI09871.1 hypothetical protein TrLO_g15277 [Triparma laevis f. longispina]
MPRSLLTLLNITVTLVAMLAMHTATRSSFLKSSAFLRPSLLSSIFTNANTFSSAPSFKKHAHAKHPTPYLLPLLSSRSTGTDNSKILTFDSSQCGPLTDLSVPQGVKLILNDKVKSYSPVNLPSYESHTIELLVKPYPSVPSGGFGKFLCDLNIGETAPLIVKPDRQIHGSTNVTNRWKSLCLLGGGTGIAPLLQIARANLANPQDPSSNKSQITMVSVNRGDDILMKEEIDALTQEHPDRFKVLYLDTSIGSRGTSQFIRSALNVTPNSPIPHDDELMILICGSDGFVDYWAGGIVRDESNKKVQGNLKGVLAEIEELVPEHVYKF